MGSRQGRPRRSSRGRALVLGCLATLATALAGLAVPSLAAAPPPPGALVAVRGAGGCLGGAHCPVPLRPFGEPHAGNGGLALVMGDRGRLLYAVQHAPAVIDVLARDPRTGALTPLPGGRGCLSARRLSGCRRMEAMLGHPVSVIGDGTIAVRLDHHRRLLLRRDARTGAVRRLGIARGCLVAFDGPCVAVRGIRRYPIVLRYAPDAALITGYGHATRNGFGGGLAIVHRDDSGHWHAVPGPDGCVTSAGGDGCAAARCLTDVATTAHLAPGGGLLYVGGGDTDLEDTLDGYLATFRLTPDGGLSLVRCVSTGAYRGSALVPVWLAPLPHSSTVLIAEERGNRGDGIAFKRIYATRPGPDGALGVPHQISGDLAGIFGPVALVADGHALYDVDDDGGSLEVERVTSHAVRRMPPPYGIAYHGGREGLYGTGGFILSGDRRFVYLATVAVEGEGIRTPPAIRAYRVAR